jgi:hypothetical protein
VRLAGPRLWEVDESAILQEYVDRLGAERAALVYPDELQRFAPMLPFATVPDALGEPLARRAPRALPRPEPGGALNAGTQPLSVFRHVHAPLWPSTSGDGMRGFAVLNGGASSDPSSPTYASQLPSWLTVDSHPVPMSRWDVRAATRRVEFFFSPH